MMRNETYAKSGRRELLAKQSTPAGSNPIGQQVATAVRRLRKAARYSVRTLAGKTGFSPSFISQIENGQASPSIASLERIAQSFGVGLSDFFETLSSDGPAVVKAHEREVIASAWSRATLEGLGTIGGQAKVEAVMITLNEEGSSGKKPMPGVRINWVSSSKERCSSHSRTPSTALVPETPLASPPAHLIDGQMARPRQANLSSFHASHIPTYSHMPIAKHAEFSRA